jgi:hypothetical protein
MKSDNVGIWKEEGSIPVSDCRNWENYEKNLVKYPVS